MRPELLEGRSLTWAALPTWRHWVSSWTGPTGPWPPGYRTRRSARQRHRGAPRAGHQRHGQLLRPGLRAVPPARLPVLFLPGRRRRPAVLASGAGGERRGAQGGVAQLSQRFADRLTPGGHLAADREGGHRAEPFQEAGSTVEVSDQCYPDAERAHMAGLSPAARRAQRAGCVQTHWHVPAGAALVTQRPSLLAPPSRAVSCSACHLLPVLLRGQRPRHRGRW